MIPKTFVPPNFVCRVRPKRASESWAERLERADNVAELAARLDELGFEVTDVAAYDFTTWLETAKHATEEACAAIEAGEEYSFKDSVWGGLRDYLFRLFDGKCAYCEGKRGGVTPGSVEHYRPKGKVTDDKNHPGYYWLAYDVTNYLPGCTSCNSKKSNRFPLENEDERVRVRTEDLTKEKPLLLNPYGLSPTKPDLSFVINWAPGNEWTALLVWAKAESPQGEASVRCLDLNREDLRTARAEVLNQVMLALQAEFLHRDKRVLKELQEGRREFSRACLAGVEESQRSGGL